jgi:hypothetical protein
MAIKNGCLIFKLRLKMQSSDMSKVISNGNSSPAGNILN